MRARKRQKYNHDHENEVSAKDVLEGGPISVIANQPHLCAKGVRSISTKLFPQSKGKSKISNVKARVNKRAKPATITTLPNDTILDIMKMLLAEEDPCTATCLGLMTRQFYPLLKLLHPKPIFVYKQVILKQPAGMGNGTIIQTQLVNLLSGFMGPKYRAASWHSVGFLNKDVYGEVRGHKENMLEERWEEYWKFAWCYGTDPWSIRVLPCPRNMGEDWYEAAEKVVEEMFSKEGEKKYGKYVHSIRDAMKTTNFFKRTFQMIGTKRIIVKKY